MNMPFVLRAFSFAGLALLCGPAVAADIPEADATAYFQAFNETCRVGFPDLDAIAKAAAAHGWIERSVSSIAMIGNNRIALPQSFSRGEMMLFLTRPGSAAFSVICQVSGTAGTRLAGRDVAALVGPALNAGRGEPGPGDYKKDDLAVWDLGRGVTVQAGVNVYKGKTRTVSLAIRQAAAADTMQLDAAPAGSSNDLSMVAIGMPFAPEEPKPVNSAHPLFHDVAVADIQSLPSAVKSSAMNFIAAAKRSSVNAALSETFRQMNMLAPSPASARKRLIVTWLGDTTPFHIGGHNSTTVRLHYRLEQVDTGQILFDRDIATSAEGGGIDASMRDNGIVRAAIATNFASAANCLDRAASGTTPAECALTPQFSVSVVRMGR